MSKTRLKNKVSLADSIKNMSVEAKDEALSTLFSQNQKLKREMKATNNENQRLKNHYNKTQSQNTQVAQNNNPYNAAMTVLNGNLVLTGQAIVAGLDDNESLINRAYNAVFAVEESAEYIHTMMCLNDPEHAGNGEDPVSDYMPKATVNVADWVVRETDKITKKEIKNIRKRRII